jgi:hypothetical protein
MFFFRLYGYLSLKAKFFGFLVVASCLVGLVCGQSGGAEFGSGNDQMAHRNNEDMLNNIYSITQRRMNLEVFKFNMWGLPRNAVLHEKKRAEQTLSQRVIPIEQIDDFVRKASREELRAIGVDKVTSSDFILTLSGKMNSLLCIISLLKMVKQSDASCESISNFDV